MERFRLVCMKGTFCIQESAKVETLVSVHNGTRVLCGQVLCGNLHLTLLCSGLLQKDLLKKGGVWRNVIVRLGFVVFFALLSCCVSSLLFISSFPLNRPNNTGY